MINLLINLVHVFTQFRLVNQMCDGDRLSYKELLDWIISNLETCEEICMSTSCARNTPPASYPEQKVIL